MIGVFCRSAVAPSPEIQRRICDNWAKHQSVSDALEDPMEDERQRIIIAGNSANDANELYHKSYSQAMRVVSCVECFSGECANEIYEEHMDAPDPGYCRR